MNVSGASGNEACGAYRKRAYIMRVCLGFPRRDGLQSSRRHARLAPVSFGRRGRRGTGQTEAERGKARAPERREALVLYGALGLAGDLGGVHVAEVSNAQIRISRFVFRRREKRPLSRYASRALSTPTERARSRARAVPRGLGLGLVPSPEPTHDERPEDHELQHELRLARLLLSPLLILKLLEVL